MKRIALLVAAAFVAGCAPKPQNYTGTLSTDDPKWNTAECVTMRMKALDYNDKVGQRVAIGIGAGLLLGPFGLPLAAAADAHQNDIRRAYSREVHLACSSQPLPDSLKELPKAAPVETEVR